MSLVLILIIVIIMLALLAGFLGKEMLKKFKILKNHVDRSSRASVYLYHGAKALEIKWDMYDLVVYPDLLGTSWGATVYLEDPVGKGSGMDPFAYIPGGTGIKRIRLWLGRTPVKLWIVPDGIVQIMKVERAEADSNIKPDVVAKPHPWQRIGIFG